MAMRIFLVLTLSIALLGGISERVQADDFSTLIANGNAQLQAGETEAALKAGDTAIHSDPKRWEGYALKGGALMDLKRYEDAADVLTAAISRAPDDRKRALRELRRQSLSAEGGAAADPKAGVDEHQTTQAEIVLWKTIENSTNPDDYAGYLKQYPSGAFAVLAAQHVDKLHEESAQRAAMAAADLERRERESVWTDVSTGLMWTRSEVGPVVGGNMGSKVDQSTAQQVCSSLRRLRYENWRLPTAAEIKTISPSSFMAVRTLSGPFSTSAAVGGIYISDVYWHGVVVPIHATAGTGFAPICVRDTK